MCLYCRPGGVDGDLSRPVPVLATRAGIEFCPALSGCEVRLRGVDARQHGGRPREVADVRPARPSQLLRAIETGMSMASRIESHRA